MEPAQTIRIDVNGATERVASHMLDEVVTELGYGAARIATAVNGTFIPAGDRAAFVLADGDRVEIVSPRQGG